ncbi:MAG: single-stranded DNA-binding protein [Methylococcales bacterium]|nr:MAG: single-stranded DNA-binding protein [Methylococcales bacterium]
MIDALVSGKLIKDPILKTGQSGKYYCQFLLSVSTGEEKPTVVSGIAFRDVAEKIAKLQKGDSISVVGALKNSQWVCKTTGNLKQGLSITVSASLSAYDIKKRRPKAEAQADQHTNNGASRPSYDSMPFNDSIPF